MSDIIFYQYKSIWFILNIVLILYAIILFCYVKFSGHKTSMSLVIIYLNNYKLIL